MTLVQWICSICKAVNSIDIDTCKKCGEACGLSRANNNRPMPGDLVKLQGNHGEMCSGSVGVIEGIIGKVEAENLVCFNDNAFRDDEVVSASGGPAYYMVMSKLRPSPRLINKLFWRWRDGRQGRDNAHYYHRVCRVWILRSDDARSKDHTIDV